MTVGVIRLKTKAAPGCGGYLPEIEETKAGLRRVRTPAGAKRYKVPIGSVILGSGKTLKNIKLVDSDYAGWDKVRTGDGTEFYIGKYDDEDVFVLTDANDKVLFEADSLEKVFSNTDSVQGALRNGKDPRKKPPEMARRNRQQTAVRRGGRRGAARRARGRNEDEEAYARLGAGTTRRMKKPKKPTNWIDKAPGDRTDAEMAQMKKELDELRANVGNQRSSSNPDWALYQRLKREYDGEMARRKGSGKKDFMGDLSYKSVPISSVDDQDEGIVTALVAVTGIKDNVNDIILPGAFEKSLMSRKAKGVWHHDVTSSVSKTLEIKELRPGDPALPSELPNGEPWPAEAGGLWVKMQFNLKTQRGRDAYEDVKFFGSDQEWSIGYNVPAGGAVMDRKTGTRSISTLNLYEYSPVLFGAMPNARTLMDVKSAQHAWKALCSSENLEIKSLIDELVEQQKAAANDEDDEDVESDNDLVDEEDQEDESANGDDDEDEEEEEEKSFADLDFHDLDDVEYAIKSLVDLRDAMIDEAKDFDFDFDDDLELKDDLVSLCKDAGLAVESEAESFDNAVADGDAQAAEEAADAVLDAVEEALEGDDPDKDALKLVTGKISTAMDEFDDEELEDEEPGEVEEEEKSETVVIDTKSFLAALD